MQVAASDFEAMLRTAKKALVIGVGGGGDIVGTIPTARFLALFGIDCILGGLSWERFVYDPQPGTRTLEEVINVRELAPTVWLANGQTTTSSGIRFAESDVADLYDTETLMIDLSQGTPGVVAGLRAAMRELEADLLVGVDVGGDSLAHGDEPGLRSPVADAMMLAALRQLQDDYACIWGVFGYGTVTFYLSPYVLYEHVATLARAVCNATSLQAASALIEHMGARSEYAFEQAMWARGAQH